MGLLVWQRGSVEFGDDAGAGFVGPAKPRRPDPSPTPDKDGGHGTDDKLPGRGGGGGDGDHDPGDSGGGDGRTRWITVASFSIPTQAHLARLRLENADIDCLLVDEHTVSTNWLLSPAIGGIKLQVPEDQVKLARELLGADAIHWDETEAIEAARCKACGKGEYVLTPISPWIVLVSIVLLGIPLLFLPRRWTCDHCGAALEI